MSLKVIRLADERIQCLPDMVEAYLGAIFVDSCFCFETVEQFYQAHIKHYFENMSLYDAFANKHPTVRQNLLYRFIAWVLQSTHIRVDIPAQSLVQGLWLQ
jgi:dsRNA-specific ribonuclease